MKILMFNYALWKNNLVRSFPFRKKVSEDHDVIFSGFLKPGSDVYWPYKDEKECLPIRLDAKNFFGDLKKLLLEMQDCDLIHCFKAVAMSYFPSLFFKLSKKLPLVLDIEDLDYYPVNFFYRLKPSALSNYLHPLADAKVVHSSFLREIYGGEIIRTGTDIDYFKPNAEGSEELKRSLGLEDKFVIPFFGAPRRYKGIELILKSIKESNKKDIVFLTIAGHQDEHITPLYSKYRRFVRTIPPQPPENMPKLLSLSDLVILPQMNYGPWCRAQIPAKLYDAMSSAKTCIVSKTGDLPDVVGDSGIVLSSSLENTSPQKEEVQECKEKLEWVYDNPSEARRLGKKARIRCVKNFSWDILKKKTLNVYKKVV